MRPVLRGDAPPGAFTNYRQARDPLIERLGDYCSYCEVPLLTQVDVEHMRPKDSNPNLSLTWSNFLLACTYCNRAKSNTDVNMLDYFWPDRDNTFLAFIYPERLPPETNPALSSTQRTIADRTLVLTGLERMPGSSRDRRWGKRWEAWSKALHARNNLSRNNVTPQRESIMDTAISTGFWSIWMTVFADDADMRKRLIDAFPGTRSSGCFDEQDQPISRPGGQV